MTGSFTFRVSLSLKICLIDWSDVILSMKTCSKSLLSKENLNIHVQCYSEHSAHCWLLCSCLGSDTTLVWYEHFQRNNLSQNWRQSLINPTTAETGCKYHNSKAMEILKMIYLYHIDCQARQAFISRYLTPCTHWPMGHVTVIKHWMISNKF